MNTDLKQKAKNKFKKKKFKNVRYIEILNLSQQKEEGTI